MANEPKKTPKNMKYLYLNPEFRNQKEMEYTCDNEIMFSVDFNLFKHQNVYLGAVAFFLSG